MSMTTRKDILAKQFERGLLCAGCSENKKIRIIELIKQEKIDAIGIYASDDGFKVYELIICIDWNAYNKQKNNAFSTADVIGLQKSGETSEVKRDLNELVRKAKERHFRLSYWISFSGALRIINPKEFYQLKRQLGSEDNTFGWMNDLGRDEVESIPDLQELIIRVRDIKTVNDNDKTRIQTRKALLLKCKNTAEQLSGSNGGVTGDYCVSLKRFPPSVSFTFQGEKRAAALLGISSINDPACKAFKQCLIDAIINKEERILSESFFSPGNGNITVSNTYSTNKKPGPNDPCPCGSGLKYKLCHGKKSGDGLTSPPNNSLGKNPRINKSQQTTDNVISTKTSNQTNEDFIAYSVFDDFVKKFITKNDYKIKLGNKGIELSESGKEIIQEFFSVSGLTKESQRDQRLLMTLVFRISIATNAFPSIWRGKYQLTNSLLNYNLLQILASIVLEVGKYSGITSEKEVIKNIDEMCFRAILGSFTVRQLHEFNRILDNTSIGLGDKRAQDYLDSIKDWRPVITKTVYEYIITL